MLHSTLLAPCREMVYDATTQASVDLFLFLQAYSNVATTVEASLPAIKLTPKQLFFVSFGQVCLKAWHVHVHVCVSVCAHVLCRCGVLCSHLPSFGPTFEQIHTAPAHTGRDVFIYRTIAYSC